MRDEEDRLGHYIYRYSRHSFLYVIGSNGKVKIGRSRSPNARLSGLQTSNPDALTLLAVVPEYVVSEEDAHVRWSYLRTRGEWFTRDSDLDAWISNLPALHRMADRLRGRVETVIARRAEPRRRLQNLAKVERKVSAAAEAERRAKAASDKQARIAAERALGCRMCKATFNDKPEGGTVGFWVRGQLSPHWYEAVVA